MKRDKQDQDRRARNREELRVIMKVKEKWTVRDKGGRRLEDLLEPGEGSM